MADGHTYNLKIKSDQSLDMEALGAALKKARVQILSVKEDKGGAFGLDFG